MKLLVITSLKEYLPTISTLLEHAGIAVYSVSSVTGMRSADDSSLVDDWFGSRPGDFDSILLFSFTGDAPAEKTLALVDAYNRENDTDFPLRAFILPVERSSQSPQNK